MPASGVLLRTVSLPRTWPCCCQGDHGNVHGRGAARQRLTPPTRIHHTTDNLTHAQSPPRFLGMGCPAFSPITDEASNHVGGFFLLHPFTALGLYASLPIEEGNTTIRAGDLHHDPQRPAGRSVRRAQRAATKSYFTMPDQKNKQTPEQKGQPQGSAGKDTHKKQDPNREREDAAHTKAQKPGEQQPGRTTTNTPKAQKP